MQMIKFTHACVRLQDAGRRLLIDPGIWTEPEAYDGVTDVLVTHEHHDHVDAGRLAEVLKSRPDLRVYAPDPVAKELAEELGVAVTAVAPGQRFEAAGFTVDTVGGRHAVTYEGMPDCANVGYVIGSGGPAVYHPGDALFVPDIRVDVLLTPVSGPWFAVRDGLDFIRAVAPRQAYPIHDRPLSPDIGMPLIDGWFERMGRTSYTRPALGVPVDL
jgi:L-ascorbate metabolism protein UlaG (beta-lactamase superfamily)